MSRLFTPMTLRGTEIRNRVWTAPMCQYSSVEGMPTSWHRTHLVTRAVGGSGLVLTEATAVSAQGRISPQDAGIWTDGQAEAYAPIAADIAAAGAVPGMQLAHAGRKASTYAPWRGTGTVAGAEGGWPTLAPSALAFEGYATPTAMTADQIAAMVGDFAAAASRAVAAGFRVLEVHAAHGYLLHEFLSPLSNERTDGYGGSLANRMRATLEVLDAIRAAVADSVPLLLRISATDWIDGGWDLEQSIELARAAKVRGVNLIDVSSGGLAAAQQIAAGPGYQVPFARAVRMRADIPTGAVGLITEPQQAEDILAAGDADVVLLARQLLREPYFPIRAAQVLGDPPPMPPQYERARWRTAPAVLPARG